VINVFFLLGFCLPSWACHYTHVQYWVLESTNLLYVCPLCLNTFQFDWNCLECVAHEATVSRQRAGCFRWTRKYICTYWAKFHTMIKAVAAQPARSSYFSLSFLFETLKIPSKIESDMAISRVDSGWGTRDCWCYSYVGEKALLVLYTHTTGLICNV